MLNFDDIMEKSIIITKFLLTQHGNEYMKALYGAFISYNVKHFMKFEDFVYIHDIIDIDLSMYNTNPTYFEMYGAIDEFMESILESGLISPIFSVRYDDNHLRIIDGSHRKLAIDKLFIMHPDIKQNFLMIIFNLTSFYEYNRYVVLPREIYDIIDGEFKSELSINIDGYWFDRVRANNSDEMIFLLTILFKCIDSIYDLRDLLSEYPDILNNSIINSSNKIYTKKNSIIQNNTMGYKYEDMLRLCTYIKKYNLKHLNKGIVTSEIYNEYSSLFKEDIPYNMYTICNINIYVFKECNSLTLLKMAMNKSILK